MSQVPEPHYFIPDCVDLPPSGGGPPPPAKPAQSTYLAKGLDLELPETTSPKAMRSYSHYHRLAAASLRRRRRDMRKIKSRMVWRWRVKQARKAMLVVGIVAGVGIMVSLRPHASGPRPRHAAVGEIYGSVGSKVKSVWRALAER